MSNTVADLSPEATDTDRSDPATLRRRRWLDRLRGSSTSYVVVAELVVIFLVWEWLSGAGGVLNPTFVPPPSAIAASAVEVFGSGEIVVHLLPSLKAWTTGLGLALLLAVPIGMLLGRSYAAHRLLGPFIWSAYAIPWLAYQPLSKVWFGFGLAPVIFLVFVAAMFPTLLNTAAGASSTDRALLNAARVFGQSRRATLVKVVLPSSLPLLIAGIRQSVAMATIALIVAEMQGPSVGLGTFIITKTGSRMVDEAFVGIGITILWTLFTSYTVKFVGDRMTPWIRDARD